MNRYYYYIDPEGVEHEIMQNKEEHEQFKIDNPEWKTKLYAPAVSTSTSASFLDGHAPASRKEAMKKEKEIAKLESIKYGTKPKDRGVVQQEINTLKGKRKEPIGTNKGG